MNDRMITQAKGVKVSAGDPRTSWKSPSDLVPEEYQNRLLYWREVFKLGYFAVGDITNELIELNAERGMRVSATDIYDAVARFVDRSPRTVRYYAETAAFFPVSVRERYDMLPFSHFVFAKTLGERWEAVLDYASSKPYLSRVALEMQFCGVVVAESEEQDRVSERVSEGVGERVSGSVSDETPVVTAKRGYFYAEAISALDGLVFRIESIAERAPICAETRQRMTRLLAELREIVPQILDELAE